ncbi:hypothetical protein [Mycoplasmopsis bovis]|nr:hypothetical protein [Mycoplasmopsis bovis]
MKKLGLVCRIRKEQKESKNVSVTFQRVFKIIIRKQQKLQLLFFSFELVL